MIGLLDSAFVASITPAAVALSPVAGMALWLKASSLALSDGDPVATWPDLSGNGNDATQATSGARPLFAAGILNGKGVVSFDGVDDFLQALAVGSSTITFFLVSRNAGTASDINVIGQNGTGTGCGYASLLGQRDFSSRGIADRLDGSSTNSWELASLKFDGSLAEMWINGASQSLTFSSSSQSAATGNLWIGAQDGASTFFAPCDIAEILIYPTALSTADREAVEAYLAAEYAL